jgi:hypothetical protein
MQTNSDYEDDRHLFQTFIPLSESEARELRSLALDLLDARAAGRGLVPLPEWDRYIDRAQPQIVANLITELLLAREEVRRNRESVKT